MSEWIQELQKSARSIPVAATVETLRRAETECGTPLPEDLAELYTTFDGGEFVGDVRLYPLHAEAGAPSVLEKSRLKLVDLPAAGVWRFGLKGGHRHLFVARKGALSDQSSNDPLPSWLEGTSEESWVYGTWDHEKSEMRFYRGLPEMLSVLVPPVEDRESFGERTYARALDAVEGALSLLTLAVPRPSTEDTTAGKALPLDNPVRAAAARRIQSLKVVPAPEKEAGSPVVAKASRTEKKPKGSAKKAVPAKAASKTAARSAKKAAPTKGKSAVKKAPAKAARSAKKATSKKVAHSVKKAPPVKGKSAVKKAPAKKAAPAKARSSKKAVPVKAARSAKKAAPAKAKRSAKKVVSAGKAKPKSRR